ncbi:hypothetical protein NQ315_007024 [Exocentrus adspersus]|uniref:Autophagy-related protein 2 n=1 Tax=Exocentrus adspersus TaxID=1586481 RepID=A0AAV8WCA0_9CUCU|nr:hypothetical protein NQ315_007024 [Exocentrus adspersus]
MSWYHKIAVPDFVKKTACRYLLQRYLGHFFEEELNRKQLNIDLYDGTGTVENISLDVQALNELGEQQNWPMEFVDGYVQKIYLRVPWSSILKDGCYIEVTGLKLTIQPKQRHESATSLFESMWNSMTSSMQLAEECAKRDAEMAPNETQRFEGLELFAQTIDSILNRVKVKFVDTVIQIEHVPQDSSTGVGIVINIDTIDYLDESGSDPSPEEATDLTNQDSKKAYLVHSFTAKKFIVQGVSLSTVEFSSKARTFSRSVLLSQSYQSDKQKDDSFVTVLDSSNLHDDERFHSADEDASSKESSPERSSELDNDRHVILLGKLSGVQEIRVRLKQSEDLVGPKVSMEMNLGPLVLFCSPRQLYVLIELAKGLATPEIEDTSNVVPRTRCVQRPMTGLDYQRVEQDLHSQIQGLSNFHIGGLQGAHGWSTAPLDESDTDDNFLPMKGASSGMYDSTLSGVSSSMDSSTNSSILSSATEQSQRTRRRMNNIETDPTAEISYFQIRLASLALVLLQEDILVKPVDSDHILAASSVHQMQQTAQHFFDNIGQVVITAYGVKGFETTKPAFENACSLNHLRLLAAPIQIEGDEKTTLSAFSITAQIVAAKMELLECLYSIPEGPVEYVPLLTFEDPAQTASPITAKPSFKMNFKHIEKTAKRCSRRSCGPRTDISRFNVWNRRPQLEQTALESKLDLRITSPTMNIKLRFPIPDFRPPHDMNKVPWWKRHVRPDFISLVLNEALFKSCFQTSQTFQEYNIQSRGVDVVYYESRNSVGLPIGKAGYDEKYASAMDELLQCRLTLKIFPQKSEDLFQEEYKLPEQDPMTSSCYGAFVNQRNEEPSPFSAKKVVHESDTPHSTQKDDAEELILPGDKQEIYEFINTTMDNCLVRVEIFFPKLSLQLQSKHVYELIYNRINNDLLLWEASAPKPKTQNLYSAPSYPTYGGFGAGLPNEGPDVFKLCKSGIQYESESESDEDSEEIGGNIFYSTCDSRMKFSAKNQQLSDTESKGKQQSNFVLNIQIGQGLANLNPPFRDVTMNNVIPGQQGEFLLSLEDANIFIVSGYRGDSDLGYVCAQVHNFQLHHCDMTSIPNVRGPLKEVGSAPSRHLHPTIQKSESGMLATAKNRGGSREMLTVAIKIQANHETHNVKTVQISLGINKATLKHRMCNEPNTWISQLLDFFNAQDYPIPGYQAKDVLIELHLHLWDCSIDYRPLYLPIRCAMTVGNFSMSSHLSAQANTSTLRFIFEECALFLSEKAPPRNGVASIAPVDLKRDYVCVVDLGIFEISLKTTDKKSGISPHIDLRASNDILNIRTCSDSGRALMQLITYFAEDGDIISSSPATNEKTPYSSPKHQVEPQLVNVEPEESAHNLSESEHEYIQSMLTDALRESESEEGEHDCSNEVGAKVFFFPDESLNPSQGKPLPPLLQITEELGDIYYKSPSDAQDDDEYCIVDADKELGMFPKSGEPEITWFTSDRVQIIENFVSVPVSRPDALKTPEDFPTPTMRYTLMEMSVVWQMYGGNDFKLQDKENRKKTVNFSDTALDTISFSNRNSDSVRMTSSSSKRLADIPWTQRGGPSRDHSVLMELHLNKMRFVHETYPETTKEASRQVLIVSEVEIWDRLECSQMNKFLYEFTSKDRPKQTNSNMVVIKAVHIRPDPKLTTQECILKVSLLPLRLNIDQDSLLFLIAYFHELAGGSSATSEDNLSTSSKHGTPVHQPPVLTVGEGNEELIKQHARKVVDENLIMLIEENRTQPELDETADEPSTSSVPDDVPIYFRAIIFTPDVPIRLDYQGKRVDMTHGSLPGLLMGLGQLNCSELRLKSVAYRHGLLGFDKLMSYLLQEWLNDIKKNQLPSLLGGVGPMHSLGVRDLFWLPIEQFQKDGRIVRGLQRGANSFTTSTAMAALELTSRIIHLIQITAETAYDMLSAGPSVRRRGKTKGKKKRYRQPRDIREGVTNAYNVVCEGIGETSDNILQVVSREKEQKGYSGVVGGVLRQIPPTILKPVIIASEATSNVLGGMRSQFAPDARREANQKWRSDDE